jgi:hypothetical protein
MGITDGPINSPNSAGKRGSMGGHCARDIFTLLCGSIICPRGCKDEVREFVGGNCGCQPPVESRPKRAMTSITTHQQKGPPHLDLAHPPLPATQPSPPKPSPYSCSRAEFHRITRETGELDFGGTCKPEPYSRQSHVLTSAEETLPSEPAPSELE